jgi:hypothetical protein
MAPMDEPDAARGDPPVAGDSQPSSLLSGVRERGLMRFHVLVRVSTMLALAVTATAATPVLAVLSRAEIYSAAERWFHALETEQGYVPTAPTTLLDGGYYHRCYDDGTCFGVNLEVEDGLTYRKEGNGAWERLGTLEELLPSLPTLPVKRLGAMAGDLADDLESEVHPARKKEAGSSTPLILGEKKRTAASRHRLRHAFRDSAPLAMLNASADGVAHLRKDLGVEGLAKLPSGVPTLDAYGIDRDVEGNVYEIMIVPPTALPEASVDVYTGDEATGATITATHQEDAPFADSDPLQSIRTEELIKWLEEDGARDAAARQRLAAGGAVFASDQFANLQDVVRSYESRMVFTFRKNVDALTTNVWSVHNRDLNEDWFYVRQQGIFSAASELLPLALVNNISSTEGNDRGRFTDLYNLNTFVDGYSRNPVVFLDQSSPITTTGVTKITSSVSWNLSGKLSGSAKCTSDNKCEIGGGAEITGGIGKQLLLVRHSRRHRAQPVRDEPEQRQLELRDRLAVLDEWIRLPRLLRPGSAASHRRSDLSTGHPVDLAGRTGGAHRPARRVAHHRPLRDAGAAHLLRAVLQLEHDQLEPGERRAAEQHGRALAGEEIAHRTRRSRRGVSP